MILMSRERVTQGDPLAMALYNITLLPLIEHLRWSDVVVCFGGLVSPLFGDLA